MRNQPLTGYLLHHKAYQESRALYYFFSQSHGVVHGVGKKGMPLFSSIDLFATGKRSLKTFSQIQPARINATNAIKTSTSISQLTGQSLYAGFYLNEILWKLLLNEEPMPKLWEIYQFSLNGLREQLDNQTLRWLLRQFELALFSELGHSYTLHRDVLGNAICAESQYRFVPDEGLHLFVAPSHDGGRDSLDNDFSSLAKTSIFSGKRLLMLTEYLQMEKSSQDSRDHLAEHVYTDSSHNTAYSSTQTQTNNQTLSPQVLQDWSRLHRQMVDHLLDFQPLQSRVLWQQYARYAK